jgi:hypothetical protein
MPDQQQLVEKAMIDLGYTPQEIAGDQPGLWTIEKGDTVTALRVSAIDSDDNEVEALILSSYLITLPDEPASEFLLQLLEWNHTLLGTEKFSTYENNLFLTTVIDLDGQSSDTVRKTIERHSQKAQEIDEQFQQLIQNEQNQNE